MDLSEFYPGHVETPSNWRLRAEGGEEFVIRVVAAWPEGGWIYHRVLHNGKRVVQRDLGVMPEINLRLLYQPHLDGERV